MNEKYSAEKALLDYLLCLLDDSMYTGDYDPINKEYTIIIPEEIVQKMIIHRTELHYH
jgi:hypothetical protein